MSLIDLDEILPYLTEEEREKLIELINLARERRARWM